jgi:hypothetical protein
MGEVIFIRRPGGSALRVHVVRIRRRRLQRAARAMCGAGWTIGRIATALRLRMTRVRVLLQADL